MANTFTATDVQRFGGPVGKSFKRVEGTLVIDTTANGGAVAGDLPKALFDLNEIHSAIIVSDGNSKIFPGTGAYDKDSLMVGGGTAGAVMDLPNDTYRAILIGK